MVSRQLECPVFKLTHADMRNGFETFIERVESQIAEYGIAKLIPPANWEPRMEGYKDDLDITIPRPIRQNVTGGRGIFRTILVEEKPMSLKDDFRPMAMLPENNPKNADNIEDLEYQFWRNLRFQPPLYGADIEGSLFDEDLQGWNLRRLNTILSRTLKETGHSIPGVVTPYLYFGMWRSIFAWHTEDMDLYSVNYLHYGAPKSWYAIQPEHRKKFEEMVQSLAETQDLFRSCSEFMRHKELVISPEVLKQHGVSYVRVVQQPREFIINFPGAYHSGFNHGFNCAESTNFATKRWVEVGAKAGFCACRKDTVKIDMSLFGVEPPPDSESEDEAPRKGKPQASEVPEKRGRGRPPGSKNKVKATTAANGAATAGTVKRGRGRPRKNPLPTSSPSGTTLPLAAGGVQKRGRGRPRKHPLPAPGEKRGRGRPRKNPKPVSAAPTSSVQKTLPDGTVKRGRGRPRKHPLPDPNQPKRPRGRPRKYPATAEPQAPRPRGRPPAKHRADVKVKAKSAVPLPVLPPGVKRPRGRPRKDGLLPGSAEATAADLAKANLKKSAQLGGAELPQRKRGRSSNKDLELASALPGPGAETHAGSAAAAPTLDAIPPCPGEAHAGAAEIPAKGPCGRPSEDGVPAGSVTNAS